MTQLSVMLLVVVLCVGQSQSAAGIVVDVILQHVDLLKSQIELLKSQCEGSTRSFPRDCADVQSLGNTASGVYNVYLNDPPRSTEVYCDLTTDGGRWLVFQRRRDGTVDFYRTWAEYSVGFGYPGGEFWIGNDALFWLTAANNETRYELRIDLEDFNGSTRYAQYSEFKVASSSLKYKLVALGSYTGNAGDSLTVHKGAEFSTLDQDNDSWDKDCANTFKGAWWYTDCHQSNLNGLYLGGPHESYADGVNWRQWTGYHYSLKISEMKIRPIRV